MSLPASPAVEIPHIATSVPMPANPGFEQVQVAVSTGMQRSSMNGLKFPAPPSFNGRASNSNPKSVRHFIRGMQLLIRQARIADPVLYACNHLTEDAADWRDMEFLCEYALDEVIPWAVFETALMARFIPAASCFEALAAFKQIKQGSKSVQEYNAIYKLRRSELASLPHVEVPDITSPCGTDQPVCERTG